MPPGRRRYNDGAGYDAPIGRVRPAATFASGLLGLHHRIPARRDDSPAVAATAARASSIVSHRGRIRLRGTDRREYLQGLLTNDIVALQPGRGLLRGIADAAGPHDHRHVRARDRRRRPDGPRRAIVTTAICEHLDRFIFSEDVQVSRRDRQPGAVRRLRPAAAAVVARSDRRSQTARPRSTPSRHGQPPPAVRRQRRNRRAA